LSADTVAIIEAWQEMAERTGLPRIRTMPIGRSRHLGCRLAEHGVGVMLEAVAAVERSPFCRGQNNRGWQPTFDFILQPSSLAKLLEGYYDPRRPAFHNPAAELLAREAEALPIIEGTLYNPLQIEWTAGD
jgi:hypothetical protein